MRIAKWLVTFMLVFAFVALCFDIAESVQRTEIQVVRAKKVVVYDFAAFRGGR